MKAATANLVTLLATARQFSLEDVAAFELPNGNTVTFTTNRGNAAATDPIFKRGGVRTQIGVEASSMTIDLLCNRDTLIDGVPAIEFAYSGGLDAANVTCTRYIAANAQAPAAGNLNIFTGRVGEMSIDATGVHLTAMSEMELLNTSLPRNMFQAGCIHDVYDEGCGLVAANFTLNGVVGFGGATVSNITTNLPGLGANYLALGTITFTGGALVGLSRSLKSYDTGTGVVSPILPLPVAPQIGDPFVVKPGCDKRFVTCNTTFNNPDNFRGYEFIPTPEASY